MIRVSLRQLADILAARLIGDDLSIDEISTDTRKLTAGCLFVALRGEQFDAHDYADTAVKEGAAALLVSKHLPIDVPQLVVEDTRLALGGIGRWVRQHSRAKVVALTGSSGKTSVKEMTASILRQCGNVLYTAGNFNNDIGVPLTLFRLTPEHDYAVIELGANHIGEIAYTTAMVCPQAALVNNLAAAHLEGFGSLTGVAQAKGEIFSGLPQDGVAIVNADSHDEARWQAALQGKTHWRFSPQQRDGVDFYVSEVNVSARGTDFTLHTPTGAIAVTLPLPGRHNIANALAAAALAQAAGAPLTAVKAGLAQLAAVPGRLFPITLAAGKQLLDDSYNANVGSMQAAVQVLAEMPGYRVMVVGDMAELGQDAQACHRQVGEAACQANIDKVLSVGVLSALISEASGSGEHFADKPALIARLRALMAQHDTLTILIKGSRSAAMEQVVHALQENATC
ncbi:MULTISPECIES: UDP-N-acetylmuramoyl-tripeptide--D-alanyl-D-alanine ligase [Dickeya]|uniref:UDP-N-acetylmuramoyl-tripeptide--D-alanyl-D-alanine ligase n=1 Tax=Dickeya aquatica TaxID=1401087 RepID=A0A375AEV0_9GAMM|nr:MULTISPECIES: UDP-N-acetylmuramoyl-tripeptide--D-alanyl-D-alanine ligase [Dickeya]SLM64613.1 UDP-N-acetylmuramoylalanyl-D-glutamyl-2,6-diaminopimelate--D-alanyl-D-alanine ligase [Dickeya aquatica]